MADYYTHFSFAVTLPANETINSLIELLTHADESCGECSDDKLISVFPNWDDYNELGFCWSIVGRGDGSRELHVWAGDECAYVEQAEALCLELLRRDPGARGIGFEWSHTCSKPRPDGFGGGALYVYRDGDELKSNYISTMDWLQQQTKENEQ